MEEITIELSTYQIAKLALIAHEKNITLNTLIIEILMDYIKSEYNENSKEKFEPEFLVEKK